MLLIDDILTFPFRGLMWVFEEIRNAAEQERSDQADSITRDLQRLYRAFESGQMTEEEFDRRESELLDQLDALQGDDVFISDSSQRSI
jgi:hypothetical protein